MALNPKHLFFPQVFYPHPHPLQNRVHNPWVDTICEGHKNVCTKPGVRWLILLQSGGFLVPLFMLLLLVLLFLPLSMGDPVVRRRQAARLEELAFATVALSGFGAFFGGDCWGFGFLGGVWLR